VKQKNNKIQLLGAALIWLFASCEKAPAQEPIGRSLDSMVLKYPFIRTDLNVMGNDSATLDDLYEKLWELKTGKRDRVTVVHIGDSHIQADFFSGMIRQNLQLEFGNAGRGTIFPYRTAKTNEPFSYRSFASNGDWAYKRNTFTNNPMPTGLAGYTLEALDTNASVLITVKDQGPLDYGFNKFTLFHSKGSGYYDFSVCDDLNCRLGYFNATEGDPMISVLTFERPMHSILLNCEPHDTSGKTVNIFGMLLENGQPGILYNMIGVNGAMYYHYNKSEYFTQQLAYLKPDLVIISMGTNEAYASGFKSAPLVNNMDTLITNIREVAPDAKFILTTPGDSFKRTRKGYVKNPNMERARNTIVDFCRAKNYAFWDLWNVMGGYGSMSKWYVSGLAAKDRLHFSQTGYELQGQLFFEALMKGYEKHIIANHSK
jgi:hypothetical protein